MLNGNRFAKKFGGASGTDPDWFLLTITGKNTDGIVVGSVDLYLADYRDPDPNNHYILNQWTWVDLSSFGNNVKTLEFGMQSSDYRDVRHKHPHILRHGYAQHSGRAFLDRLSKQHVEQRRQLEFRDRARLGSKRFVQQKYKYGR